MSKRARDCQAHTLAAHSCLCALVLAASQKALEKQDLNIRDLQAAYERAVADRMKLEDEFKRVRRQRVWLVCARVHVGCWVADLTRICLDPLCVCMSVCVYVCVCVCVRVLFAIDLAKGKRQSFSL